MASPGAARGRLGQLASEMASTLLLNSMKVAVCPIEASGCHIRLVDIMILAARVQAAVSRVTADRTVVPSHGNHLEARSHEH